MTSAKDKRLKNGGILINTFKERLGWGILGPGRIGRDFAKCLEYVPDAYVAAAGSRDPARSREFCRTFGGTAYGSYEELVQDPNVDIIYVAVPHPMHESAVKLASDAGKAVLCEKPFAVNRAQAESMFDYARRNGTFLMEGLWSRFFPAWRYVKELLESGELGKIVNITSLTGWGHDPKVLAESDRLLDPNLAGGALLDGGVYSLAAMTVAMGRLEEPTEFYSTVKRASTGVDAESTMLMRFADGMTANLMCGLYRKEFETTIACENGIVVIPRHRNPDTVIVRSKPRVGYAQIEWEEEKVLKFPFACEGFQYEAQVVQQCVRDGLKTCPEVTPEETLYIAGLCDHVRRNAGFYYPFETPGPQGEGGRP